MPDIPSLLSVNFLPLIFGIILVAALLVFVWNALIRRGSEYPYTKNESLFSKAERSFLGVLEQAVGSSYRIFGKVRLADAISVKPTSDRKRWWQAFGRISSKHLDFLLCDPKDLSIQAAIELDDGSHTQKQRKSRDAFLTEACQAAGLP